MERRKPPIKPRAPGFNGLETWRAQADQWQIIRGEDHYARQIPNLVNFRSRNDQLKQMFLREISRQQVPTPPEDLYFLDDCFVSEIGFVYRPSGEIFGPSLIDHSTVHPLTFLQTLTDEPIPVLDGLGLFPFKAGKDNYGHVFAEMLPKLENVQALTSAKPQLIVPRLPGPIATGLQSLVEALYPGKFEFHWMRHPLLRVRHLIYPGPVSKHAARKSKTLLSFIDRLLQLKLPELHRPKRLYVSRERIAKRRMINEPQVRAFFERRGFAVVHPEELSLLEQISLFRGAELVAGPLGAGLANIMFAPERAELIMLDPGLYDFFFFDLCGINKQGFTWVFSGPISPKTQAMLFRDYRFPKRVLPAVF